MIAVPSFTPGGILIFISLFRVLMSKIFFPAEVINACAMISWALKVVRTNLSPGPKLSFSNFKTQ
jgi:hypothetical protein